MKYSILEDPRYHYLSKPKSPLLKFFSFLFDFFANTVLTFYAPVTVIGRENIPKDTPFIFCSNHNSHMDIAVLVYTTRLGYERFGFLAAKDYWFDNKYRRKFFKNFITLIPIERRNKPESLDLEDTFLLSKAFVSQNNNIIMFPEGSRGEPGVMQRFRKGAMKFSLELNIPVVPAVILGTEKAWPRKGRFIHSVPIDIHVLPPIYPKDCSEMNKTEYNKTIVKQTKILENLINDNYSLLRSDDSNNSSAK